MSSPTLSPAPQSSQSPENDLTATAVVCLPLSGAADKVCPIAAAGAADRSYK